MGVEHGAAAADHKKRVGKNQQGLPARENSNGENEGKYFKNQQGGTEGGDPNVGDGSPPAWGEYLRLRCKENGELDASTTWDGFFRSQGFPATSISHDLYSVPPNLVEWTPGFTTNHVTEVNKESGVTEHTFYFSAGLRTYRLSRLTDPSDYKLLSSLSKFTQVKIDSKKYNPGRGRESQILVPKVFMYTQRRHWKSQHLGGCSKGTGSQRVIYSMLFLTPDNPTQNRADFLVKWK